METANLGFYYRYEETVIAEWHEEFDAITSRRVELQLQRLLVLSRTPKGVWVSYRGDRKFVLDNALKHFACKTEGEALESFIARKQRHAFHLNTQCRIVETALGMAEALRDKIIDQLS